MKQYSVYYSGGSGGNMFYLSLRMVLGHAVTDTIKKQWDIKNIADWKKSEQTDVGEPDLDAEVSIQCNAGTRMEGDGIMLVVYTDVETHLALAKLKNANWYTLPITDWVVESYLNIKDPSWPEVTCVKDLHTLPLWIQHELIADFNFQLNGINDDLTAYIAKGIRSSYEMHDGLKIHNTSKRLVDQSEHSFLLQDVIRTKFKCVCDELRLKHTQAVADHVDYWVALHPQNIQDMLQQDI